MLDIFLLYVEDAFSYKQEWTHKSSLLSPPACPPWSPAAGWHSEWHEILGDKKKKGEKNLLCSNKVLLA